MAAAAQQVAPMLERDLPKLRARTGLRQTDVARCLGVDKSTVCRLERAFDPGVGLLDRYAAVVINAALTAPTPCS